MIKIKFGTDGWRAIIAREFTEDNVKRVSQGLATYMAKKDMKKCVVGYDCRFAGSMFADAVCSVLGAHGYHVVASNGFVSTPMVSLAVKKCGADIGVVITASHNPPSYNGYKLKASYGGPSIPSEVAAVEAEIPDTYDIPTIDIKQMSEKGLLEIIDLEQMYMDHVLASFDMDLLANSGAVMAYDAMFGAGQNVVNRLFPDAVRLHCSYNPSFLGTAPEPIDRNLKELSEVLANNDQLTFGWANDGDADRIGMYDENGLFVDSHRLLCLLLVYLYEFKGLKDGKVAYSFSVTNKLGELAEMYGLPTEVTKIGFKYIAEIMSKEPVLVGGEESGGIAVSGHIPERDGIWCGLLMMEYMAKTGKTLKQLTEDLYSKIGRFDFYRDDLHISNDKKWAIVDACKAGQFDAFGTYKITKVEDLDGHKFFFNPNSWVMIRPSGTEPVLRVYAQGADMDEVRSILDNTHRTLESLG